jgi:biopolymer transport protein ExbD
LTGGVIKISLNLVWKKRFHCILDKTPETMADITQTDDGQKKAGGKVRAKKQSTRIDMTPMVDLAFLLLTFFILTATFNKHRAMDLTMPDKTDTVSLLPVKDKDVLNLVLAGNNRIYWWIGLDPPVKLTNYSKDGIRKILLDESENNPKLIVLIKPKDESRYENMVDLLDEVEITQVKRYAIVDVTEHDKMLIAENSAAH